MARLPVISGDDFVRAMGRVGYTQDHTRGNHMILVHPLRQRLSVPKHRELGRCLLRCLLRDADVSRRNSQASSTEN
ncbi:MAG: addiction module toxin, HicA family [Chloroflexi bacterium]|nr:addiction module toxin, HicA family [Chloroflexota bacterium]